MGSHLPSIPETVVLIAHDQVEDLLRRFGAKGRTITSQQETVDALLDIWLTLELAVGSIGRG